MSDEIGTTNVRRSADSLEKQPVFDGYSKVILKVSDDLEYVAGDDSGRTFTTSSPWGTQAMANRILSKIRGFQYQTYTASNAYIDPAAEIGDGVTIGKLYSGIFSKDVSHGPLYTANIAAPGEKKIDYKYPYKSTQERKVSREMRNLTAELRIQADRIAAEVAERKSQNEETRSLLEIQAGRIATEVAERKSQGEEFRALFEVQSQQISAKVNKTGGSASSFGWVLNDSSWTIQGNNRDILKATSSGLEVYGKVTATSGKIGGFDILSNYLSYNNQTWGGTNTQGIYIGSSGIQLGKNFRVDNSGNLTAASGNFSGNVNAGNIQYGGSSGYFSGSGLAAGSVKGGSGGAISGGSLSTYNMTGGIKTSLGYADYANGVFNGWNVVSSIRIAERFAFQRYDGGWETIKYKDHNGINRTLTVMSGRII